MQLEMFRVDPGMYRHFKGGLYEVIDVAVDAETATEYVVYRSRTTGQLFVRPKSRFVEHIRYDGTEIPRFQRIIEDEPAHFASGGIPKTHGCCITFSRFGSFARTLWSSTRQALLPKSTPMQKPQS